MIGCMVYVTTLSPLHCGAGQGTGLIDLPITRVSLTKWPEIPGSTIKGTLRQAVTAAGIELPTLRVMFGPDRATAAGDDDAGNAGAMWFSGAQLLCFPVRTLRGTMMWVTSPMALRIWERTLTSIGQALPFSIPVDQEEGAILVTNVTASRVAVGDAVMLEDLDFKVSLPDAVDVRGIASAIATVAFAGDIAWQEHFMSHFGIVPDSTFAYLVSTTSETRARIRIDADRKMVSDGQFWSEETVPADAVFYLSMRQPPFGRSLFAQSGAPDSSMFEIIAASIQRPVQIGGNASVGQGVVQITLDPSTLRQEVLP